MSKEFKRRNWTKHSRIGNNRKNRQTWRRAKGRHNKVREKRKGYPIKVMIGFRTDKKARGLVEEKKPILVSNMKELQNVKEGQTAIIANVGKKKRIEMAKKANEKGIHVSNIRVNRLLKRINKQEEKK